MKGYEKRIYKCLYCGEFEVDTLKYTKCTCGANELQVDYDSTLYYKNGSVRLERNIYPSNNSKYFRDYKIIEKYAYPFYKMTKPQQKLYDRIIAFDNDKDLHNNFHYYEDFETMQDGKKQLSYFSISISGCNYSLDKNSNWLLGQGEINEINLCYSLNNKTNKKELTKSMLRFYKILYLIKNNKLDINTIKSRDELKKLTCEYQKTQKEIYDYEFYC